MAEKYYPHDYLPMPLQDGYAFQPISPLKRTEMTTGRAAAQGIHFDADTGQCAVVYGNRCAGAVV
jgi:hypothetical protein